MRNIEKITALKSQVDVLRNRTDYLLRQKAKLTEELGVLKKAHLEVQTIIDAVLAQTAITYGVKDDAGNYEIRIPRPYTSVLDLYKVAAENDGETRIIRAEVRNGTDQERDSKAVAGSADADQGGRETAEGTGNSVDQEV